MSNKIITKNHYLYRRWYSMMDRCYNPKNPNYFRYGGRKPKPIKVCDRWHDYKNFEDDLYESFLKHVLEYGINETTIDRWPDKLGNYEPANVRWATRKEQQNNLTNNRMVTEKLNVAQFAEKYGLNHNTVLTKLNKGMTAQEILDTYGDKNGTIYYLPCGKSLREHCKINDYKYETIISYINKYNLTPQDALVKYLQSKRLVQYYLPCGKSLKEHCVQNNYKYTSVINYIHKYNLNPHEALSMWLEYNQKHKKQKYKKHKKQKQSRPATMVLPTGETLTEFSKRTGISRKTLESRIHRGWSLEKIVNTPLQGKYSHK